MIIIIARRDDLNRNIVFESFIFESHYNTFTDGKNNIFFNFTEKKEKDIYNHFRRKFRKTKIIDLEFYIVDGFKTIPTCKKELGLLKNHADISKHVSIFLRMKTFKFVRDPSNPDLFHNNMAKPDSFVKYEPRCFEMYSSLDVKKPNFLDLTIVERID